LLISFSLFLIIGVPIAFVLGLTPLVALLYEGETPLMLAAQRIFTGMDNPVLMAIPFFILAGNIMTAGGLTRRLVTFCKVLVGPVRGGLAYINVVISMIFAGITGAAVADTSAIGSILIPAMEREGYDVEFSSAVTATSSTIGPVIPPSIPFIIYGVLGEVSIAFLFLAGIIPGLLLGLFQMGIVAYYARNRNYPKGSLPSAREALRAIFDAALVLMMPIIILGGILSGVFTPTESACIAVFYAFAISFFVYRGMGLRDLPRIIIDSGVTSALVMLVIGTASIFSWVLASQEIPQSICTAILKVTHNRILILLFANDDPDRGGPAPFRRHSRAQPGYRPHDSPRGGMPIHRLCHREDTARADLPGYPPFYLSVHCSPRYRHLLAVAHHVHPEILRLCASSPLSVSQILKGETRSAIWFDRVHSPVVFYSAPTRDQMRIRHFTGLNEN
jgi:C4-dicarboxylate transporter DctM subunit